MQCREEQCENSSGICLGAEGWRVSLPGITTRCAVHAHEPWTELTEANSQAFSATQFTHVIKRAINWERILLHYFGCMLQKSWLIFHPGEKEGKKWSKKFLQHLNWIYSCWQLLVLCFTPSFHCQETVNSRAFSKEPKRGGSLLDRVISLARSSADNHFHWRCRKVAHNSFLLYNKCRTIKCSTLRYCAQNCGTIHHCLLIHNSIEWTHPKQRRKKANVLGWTVSSHFPTVTVIQGCNSTALSTAPSLLRLRFYFPVFISLSHPAGRDFEHNCVCISLIQDLCPCHTGLVPSLLPAGPLVRLNQESPSFQPNFGKASLFRPPHPIKEDEELRACSAWES